MTVTETVVRHRCPPGHAPEPVLGAPPADRWRHRRQPSADRRRAWLVLLGTVVFLVLAGGYGADVTERLSNAGYTPRSAESVQAEQLLNDHFMAGTPNLVFLLRGTEVVDDPRTAQRGRAFTEHVAGLPGVAFVDSYWSTGDPSLRSGDRLSALVLVRLAGDEDRAQRAAADLVPTLTGGWGGFEVRVTGEAQANVELQRRSDEDLVRAELIGAPITLLILLLVFRTPVAALLPFVVGVISVVVTLAVLRLLVEVTEVSVFALNLVTVLGFGLAVDYSLFVVTRFREELARTGRQDEAIRASVRTAGRTVVFSAATVALCLAALLVFPVYFLSSLAYAAIPVVMAASLAAVTVLPAMLTLWGRWVDAADVVTPLRRRLGLGEPRTGAQSGQLWAALASWIVRRPVLVALPTVTFLVLLALPFGHARFGLTDHRVLPPDANAHVVAEEVGHEFDLGEIMVLNVVLTGLDTAAGGPQVDEYARQLSTVAGVTRVDAGTGTYAGGVRTADLPVPEVFTRPDATRLRVVTEAEPFSGEGERLVHAVREVPAPGDRHVGGLAAVFTDTRDAVAARLPVALGLIGVTTFALLFLFTGSVVIPVKALLLNLLSLTATFGAMVYVFQDGHLRGLVGDFVTPGYLDVTVPLLMFCVAFGLSMDYEVFVLARIREEYLRTGDNTRAVVAGLARTGALVSAAALLIGVVLGLLATSGVSVLKLLGVGLCLSVLVDAVVIRGVLVPAFMRLLGERNWWAPRSLQRLHERVGVRDG
ncbi:MAG TPA: MMPL family transporter [Micromonosporaceae bacterium]|nr:MMPL family transporter [Micromonosporaceae bacterium]